MISYALDTNIVSYFLKGDPKIVARMRLENSKDNQFIIPPIVYFEIKNWLLKNNSKSKLAAFEKMYSSQGIGVIDKIVLDIASTVKLKMQNQGKGISDDDLFIAAYCLKYNLPLVTNNSKHFINVDNLEILNWLD
ncbi:MAG: PIN domain-containing protein [Treponema sp.]|jgi:tRNA(fMet)-specific endonuclease VapC|nr:PIN domain-containing protein [Treponema sp.]